MSGSGSATPSGRFVRLQGELIKTLRIQKGWGVSALATKAICSVKTVENLEMGAPVQLSTLNKIAKALDVEPKILLVDPPIEGQDATAKAKGPRRIEMGSRRIEVSITLKIDFEEFDETNQLLACMMDLSRRIAARSEIDVVAVRSGSVILDLLMSEDDFINLVFTYANFELRRINNIDVLRVVTCKNLTLSGNNGRLFLELYSKLSKASTGKHEDDPVFVDVKKFKSGEFAFWYSGTWEKYRAPTKVVYTAAGSGGSIGPAKGSTTAEVSESKEKMRQQPSWAKRLLESLRRLIRR